MDSERIILGSGKLYCMVFTGEIPEDTAIETDANQLAHIKGGASLEYTAETYTAKDDLGVVQKTVLTSEDVTFLHEDSEDGNIRVTIVGRNEAGFSFTFAKDAESTIEPQFKAHPLDKDGTLLIFDEDIVTEV